MWLMCCVTGWLFVSGIMDIRTRRLPLWMLAVGGALSLLAAICQQNVWYDALKGMVPGLLLLLIAFVTKKAGYGDGIALSCLGMVLGGEKCLLLFGLSLFLLAICSLLLLVLRKVGKNTKIPFLPFLAAAWFVVMK